MNHKEMRDTRVKRAFRSATGLLPRLCLAYLPALAAACSGPKVYVSFPGSQSAATAPASAPEPPEATGPASKEVPAPAAAAPVPATPPAPPAEPPPPYWVLYATWWSDHQDLLRKLDSATFPLPSLEGMFRSSEESLGMLGQRLDPPARKELSAFLERYDRLRKEALRDGNRGILRQGLDLLGKEISRRFSTDKPAAAPVPPRSSGGR